MSTTTESTIQSPHIHKHPYERVFLALAIITAIEILASLEFPASLRALQISLLLILAVSKAVLVAMFFMHIKYEKRPIALTITVFGVPLLLALPLALLTVLDWRTQS